MGEKELELPQAQREVMQALWDHGGSLLFAQVAAALEQKGKRWKTNTILTLLSRLAERGMLEIRKEGRLNRYVALVSESDYLQAQTERFVEHVYGGNARHLLSALLERHYLTGKDCDELRRYWEEGKP